MTKAVESAQGALGYGQFSDAVETLTTAMQAEQALELGNELGGDDKLIKELQELFQEAEAALAAHGHAAFAEAALSVLDYATAKMNSEAAMSHGKLLRHHSADLTQRITELHERVRSVDEAAGGEEGFPAY